MANAQEAVKRVCDFVTKSNEEEGVAYAIDRVYPGLVCYASGRPVCADGLSIVGEKYELEVNMAGRDKKYSE